MRANAHAALFRPMIPEAPSRDELPALAQAVMRRARFPCMATVDAGQPRVRPVSPVRTEGFTVYVANLRRYRKTEELSVNPCLELCYLDENHDQVRITGVAEVETDPGLLSEIWNANPLLRKYLGSADNPELIIYCIRPTQVKYMREWALEYHIVPMD